MWFEIQAVSSRDRCINRSIDSDRVRVTVNCQLVRFTLPSPAETLLERTSQDMAASSSSDEARYKAAAALAEAAQAPVLAFASSAGSWFGNDVGPAQASISTRGNPGCAVSAFNFAGSDEEDEDEHDGALDSRKALPIADASADAVRMKHAAGSPGQSLSLGEAKRAKLAGGVEPQADPRQLPLACKRLPANGPDAAPVMMTHSMPVLRVGSTLKNDVVDVAVTGGETRPTLATKTPTKAESLTPVSIPTVPTPSQPSVAVFKLDPHPRPTPIPTAPSSHLGTAPAQKSAAASSGDHSPEQARTQPVMSGAAVIKRALAIDPIRLDAELSAVRGEFEMLSMLRGVPAAPSGHDPVHATRARAAAERARNKHNAAGLRLDELRAASIHRHAEAVMMTKEVAASVKEAMRPLFTETTATSLRAALEGFRCELLHPMQVAEAGLTQASQALELLLDQAKEILDDDAALEQRG